MSGCAISSEASKSNNGNSRSKWRKSRPNEKRFLNPAIRVMFEWSRIVDTDNSSETRRAANGMDIVQGRVQFVY